MQDLDKLWRCSCGGSLLLSIRYFDYGKDSVGYLAIESAYRATGLWERLKVAWQVLTKGVCALDEVLIDSPQVAREMAEAINLIGDRLAKEEAHYK